MRRMISFILAFIMLCGLSGCGGNTEKPVATGGSAAITDALGREVSVPETVERIVVLGNAPRMAVYLGLDGLVAGGHQGLEGFPHLLAAAAPDGDGGHIGAGGGV